MNRRRFKFLRMVSILSVGLLFFVLCVKAADLIDVRVDLTDEKQLIRGFGGMNHPVWISDLTPAQRETAFGNGPGQLGFTILRIHV
ncbi:MAG: carbohydrate-binding protein, partial [Halanaerobiales bacterium]